MHLNTHSSGLCEALYYFLRLRQIFILSRQHRRQCANHGAVPNVVFAEGIKINMNQHCVKFSYSNV